MYIKKKTDQNDFFLNLTSSELVFFFWYIKTKVISQPPGTQTKLYVDKNKRERVTLIMIQTHRHHVFITRFVEVTDSEKKGQTRYLHSDF